jgi:preprotein translocase subunit SecG
VLILLTLVHVLVCVFLILVVLLQQGKGADLSVFGGGGTQAAFGARGATTLLHKLTVASFVAFVVTTMAIGLMTTTRTADEVIEGLPEEAVPAAPAPEPSSVPPATGGEPAPGPAPAAGEGAPEPQPEP